MPATRLVPPEDWPTLGWQVIEWCEHYLCHGPGDIQGEPLFFDDEFTQITLDLYRLYPKGHDRAGRRVVTYGGVSLPKGRAKSEFAGAIAAAELCGPVRCDGFDAHKEPVGVPVTYPFIRILATEEGQTGHTYGNTMVMLEHAREKFAGEWCFDKLDIGSTRILVGKSGTEGVVIPSTAGAASKDGGKETFAVADEVHLYSLPELRSMHDTVRRNSVKRKKAQSWMLATTTMFEPGAGSVAEDLFDEAEKLVNAKRRSHEFFWHHRQGTIKVDTWSDDDAQLASLREAYGEAAEWMDLEAILTTIRAPGAQAAHGARYFHNAKWKGENKAIDPEKWDKLADPKRTPAPSSAVSVVLGFDGSDRGERADDTALIGWTVEPTPHLFLIDRWRRPERAGADYRVPRREVREAVTATREAFNVRRFAADPPGWREEIDTWDEEFGNDGRGDPIVVEVLTNRPSVMGPAIDRFLEMVDLGSFTHDGSPELREYALNAVLTKAKGRPDLSALAKEKFDLKIDGLVAAIVGLSELVELGPEEDEASGGFVWLLGGS